MVHPGSSRTASSVAKPYFDEPGCTEHVYTYYTVPVCVTTVFLKISRPVRNVPVKDNVKI